MKTKRANDSIKDYIMEKDSFLYYVVTPIQKKYSKKEPCDTPRFFNFVQKNLLTSNKAQYSKTIDVSRLRVYTFLVINSGYNPVICQVEMSPDGITWSSFGEPELVINPGTKQAVVSQYFLRFVRIKYKNKNAGFNSSITIWFQGQS